MNKKQNSKLKTKEKKPMYNTINEDPYDVRNVEEVLLKPKDDKNIVYVQDEDPYQC